MDRQAGDDGVERSRLGQRLAKVVGAKLDQRVVAEALRGASQHRLRGVETDCRRLRVAAAHQRQHATVTGAEVDEALDPCRQRLKQHLLCRRSVRYLSREVLGNPLGPRPLARRWHGSKGRATTLGSMGKVLYTAAARVTGGRVAGHGRTSDGALEVDLRTPPEMGGDGGGTNPEQLFAVGYAACFESA